MTTAKPVRRQALPHVLAIAYAFFGWALGVWLMTIPSVALNVGGVLLTAHALVISAYLIHDCVHNAVFTRGAGNDRLGRLLTWLNGACVADYSRLKIKHLRHHTDRIDAVTFDYREVLIAAPSWVRKGVLALEWAYVPAVEFLIRVLVVVRALSPAQARAVRIRAAAVLTIRAAAFALLAVWSVKAALLYAIAYCVFLQVLRFMDAFQHTYEVYPSASLEPAPADPRRTLAYEHDNTYSNLLSERWAWLNLLVLNFPYHNAHHVRPGAAWYRLPDLHRSLYPVRNEQVLPLARLLRNYHRGRCARVLSRDYGAVSAPVAGRRDASTFLGAVGVSFLTAV
jgi:fatty acid desaturase